MNASPDNALLRPQPKKAKGVRRLNRWPTAIGCGVVGLAALGIWWNFPSSQTWKMKDGDHNPKAADAGSFDGLIHDHVKLVSSKPTITHQETPKAKQVQETSPAPAQPTADAAEQARRRAWLDYYAEQEQVDKAKFEIAKASLTAGTLVGGSGQAAGTGTTGTQIIQGSSAGMVMPGLTPGMLGSSGYGGYGGGYGGYGGGPPVLPDVNGAREKQQFMATAGDVSGRNDTLMSTVRPALSPYEITAGDYVNCVAVGGENSDAPGRFVGRVAQNIYDSATGRFLLIPQGSKIVGIYDNEVSAGQTRIPTAITRIIFPDSSSINIGAMPAADQSGFAGLHDQVNTHWWAKFGNALIVGLAGAGAQIAGGGGGFFGNGYSPLGVGIAGGANTMSQVAQETARSGLSIPNTLEIGPGYRFTIQITKDMIFPGPWHDARGAAAPISLGPVLQ